MLRGGCLVCLMLTAAISLAQTQPRTSSHQSGKTPAGSISGHTTMSSAPASGVVVILALQESRFSGKTVGRVKSDQNGQYEFQKLKPGQYKVSVDAYALGEAPFDSSSATIMLDPDQNVSAVDFSLVCTGVITGRLVDSAGRPVISAYVSVGWVDNDNIPRPTDSYRSALTDDRGNYRIFGLVPGKYRVSMNLLFDYRDQVYYPGTRDASKVSLVSVAAGQETNNINITYTNPARTRTYTITGHVTDADTGEPIAGANCYAHSEDERLNDRVGSGESDSTGYFQIGGAEPGKYSVTASTITGGYGDDVPVEVGDGDVTGVEIKYHKGGSVSGVVVIESDDPSVVSQITSLEVHTAPGSFSGVRVGADGGFILSGLRPGLLSLWVRGGGGRFSIDRVERDGVQIGQFASRAYLGTIFQGVSLAPNESITGLRIFVAYGDGAIKGQINVVGGTLPANAKSCVLSDAPPDMHDPSRLMLIMMPGSCNSPDIQGRFVIQNMRPGIHRVTVFVWGAESHTNDNPFGIVSASQDVSVANGSESSVTLVLDLSPKKTGGER